MLKEKPSGDLWHVGNAATQDVLLLSDIIIHLKIVHDETGDLSPEWLSDTCGNFWY